MAQAAYVAKDGGGNIVSVQPSPQAGLAATAYDDPAVMAFLAPPPSIAAALAAGLAIASAGTPALDATYGCAAQDEINIVSMQAAILTSPSLFRGYWRDIKGAKVAMTAAQFTAIAEAILAYVAALDDWLAAALAGTSAAMPPAAAAIA